MPSFGATAASLAACSVELCRPIGAPGVMPQTSTIAAHADRGKSWMKPRKLLGGPSLCF